MISSGYGVKQDPDRYCKKCLLSDLDKDNYFKNIYEYIECIPAERKSDAGLYEARLAVCKGCDSLINGMCRVCGCFVEIRAAISRNYCPHIKKYW